VHEERPKPAFPVPKVSTGAVIGAAAYV